MITLSRRSDKKEYIDDLLLDAEILRQTHREMLSINKWTLGYWPSMSAVKYFLEHCAPNRVVKILDIGCGDGELLRRIDSYGREKNLSLELTGIDLNPQVIAAAVQLSASKINFINGDVFFNNGKTYDIIINSLTTHHLSDQKIVELMQWMTTHARIGWSISDLNRHAIAYYFIKFFIQLKGYNYVICHDAPLSVARSFRRQDWLDLLNQAGINPNLVKIFWYPNFRYGIRYEKLL